MKNFFLLFAFLFLGAGCSLFSKAVPAGVVKTVNGGTDWQFSNTVKDSKDNLGGLNISKLAFAPESQQKVFAGSYMGGLFRSEDSGQSWVRILSKILVYDFAIDPNNSKNIYVAGAFGGRGKVLKTTDGGGSWQEVYNEETVNNPVRAVAINQNQTTQLVIGTQNGAVIKSNDGGLSWKFLKNFDSRVNVLLWQNNSVFVLLKTKGLFKSDGFEGEFVDVSKGLTKTFSVGDFSYTSSSINSFNQVYVDSFANNLIYMSTSSGLYKTTDTGTTWQKVNLPVEDATENRAVAISKNNSNVIFSSVGSTIYKTVDGGITWQTQSIASSAFVQYILIDSQLPQIVYAGLYVLGK